MEAEKETKYSIIFFTQIDVFFKKITYVQMHATDTQVLQH